MSGSDPRGPNLLRGALVSVDTVVPIPKLVIFQYNPDSVVRELKARAPSEGASRLTATRLSGAPIEKITMDVEIDAADQLANSDPTTMALGIYPQLSTLEMLIYPSSIEVIANTALLLAGTIELLPPTAPLTLLVWGLKRIVPVRVDTISITESMYDTQLNPIRAKAGLGLTVMSYEDLSVTNAGYYIFLAHHVLKEGMALLNTATGLSSVLSGKTSLL